jgi:hypothetical protein
MCRLSQICNDFPDLFLCEDNRNDIAPCTLPNVFDRIRLFVLIPAKVVTDSDLIPVTGSEAKPGTLGAQRRWRRYGA